MIREIQTAGPVGMHDYVAALNAMDSTIIDRNLGLTTDPTIARNVKANHETVVAPRSQMAGVPYGGTRELNHLNNGARKPWWTRVFRFL
jgi:hypothetical protein